MIEKLERYKVNGAWVDEPFVTMANEDMVLADKARAREDALLKALKSLGVELPHDGWCFCNDSYHEVDHTILCDKTNDFIRQIEATR